MSDYTADPIWEYGFRMDGGDAVWSRMFGLPFTSLASAEHSAEKNYWFYADYVRHPKGSTRDDDWEPVPPRTDKEDER